MMKAFHPVLVFLLSIAGLLAGQRVAAQSPLYAAANGTESTLETVAVTPSDNAPDGGACSDLKGGTYSFATGSADISTSIKSQLSALAAQMRAYPNCRVVVLGHGGGGKFEEQLSWDHVANSIGYMADIENIDRSRFIFQYGATGDVTMVDYRVAGDNESGPSTQPRPQH